jgi:hypothetical protein
MGRRRHHLGRQVKVAALSQTQVEYRSGICQHTNSVYSHLVLAEKKLSRHESFDQFRLGIIKPVSFDQLDPGSQTT